MTNTESGYAEANADDAQLVEGQANVAKVAYYRQALDQAEAGVAAAEQAREATVNAIDAKIEAAKAVRDEAAAQLAAVEGE